MKNFLEKHRRPYGIFGAIAALVIAIIYLAVVPIEAPGDTGLQQLILRYGHSLCWILLGAASFLWGMKNGRRLSELFAYSALCVYVIFIATFMFAKYI